MLNSTINAISLIKGVKFIDSNNSSDSLQLLSNWIQTELNLTNVAVLMGANVASDVAQDKALHKYYEPNTYE